MKVCGRRSDGCRHNNYSNNYFFHLDSLIDLGFLNASDYTLKHLVQAKLISFCNSLNLLCVGKLFEVAIIVI